MKAAVRETEEEAGIPASKLKIHHDFPYEMHYEVKFHGSQRFFTPKQKTVCTRHARLEQIMVGLSRV
jgi:8-oxo-dGTP pyrophosphatase MutT (NUDIX family)